LSDIVIRAESIGKKYTIGHQSDGERYTALRDVIARSASSLWRKTKDLVSGRPIIQGDSTEEFWALNEVSFAIRQGEAVGIIGRNGAGKSTLLKVLSRITEPSTGRVTIKGRVASLLEVGTGFHPELNGRENIYLNGAILGMTRAEIRRKFDEIVAFAEVETFLDTPVKHYSSGMYVRLAFAVAAHLEPEILVVDEVLAVGDAQFQKKCLGKMSDVAKGGRTVLFVSHNLQAVRSLCARGILLDKGDIILDDMINNVLFRYKQCITQVDLSRPFATFSHQNRRGSGEARLTSVQLMNGNGAEGFEFQMRDTIKFKLSYKVFQDISELLVYIGLRSFSGREIVTSFKHFISDTPMLEGTQGTIIVELDNSTIRPGEYPLYFWLGDRSARMAYESFDIIDNLTSPIVIRANDENLSLDIDPNAPSGYFSIPSRLTHIEME
jgi:lipopolysaccharide transport system ATP-binding protein